MCVGKVVLGGVLFFCSGGWCSFNRVLSGVTALSKGIPIFWRQKDSMGVARNSRSMIFGAASIFFVVVVDGVSFFSTPSVGCCYRDFERGLSQFFYVVKIRN